MKKKTTVLTKELAAFLESGLAIVVATRDESLQPDGAPAWAVRVLEDLRHVTVFVHAKSAPALLENLERHREIAIVLDKPSTHRACQIKGTLVSSRKARAGERDEIVRQLELFRSDLGVIGIPEEMTIDWQAWPGVALEVSVSQVFEQTPGPGAGEPLK